MVGDQITDLEAGWGAGCRTVLVGGSPDGETRRRLATSQHQPDYIGNGLGAAVDWILRNLGAPSRAARLEKEMFSL
jgi:phosphoglycolate phosphatase-like HAD superfamily hydrolase